MENQNVVESTRFDIKYKGQFNNNNNNNNNNKYLFTHKSIIFKNAVIDFKWVLTTWNNHRGLNEPGRPVIEEIKLV